MALTELPRAKPGHPPRIWAVKRLTIRGNASRIVERSPADLAEALAEAEPGTHLADGKLIDM
jgi:hypothetical protein